MKRIVSAVVAMWLGLLCAFAGTSWAFQNEPKGFEKAEFGMSVKKVRALYPTMHEVDPAKVSSLYNRPGMASFEMAGQKVEWLPKPVDVVFRFLNDQFWVVLVKYGTNDSDDVEQGLHERYGETKIKGIWVGDTVTLALHRRDKSFELSSRALAAEAEKQMLPPKVMKGLLTVPGATPEAAPKAEAAPTPATVPPLKGEPTGFGKAEFLASIDAVRTLYPAMQEVDPVKYDKGGTIRSFLLSDQQVDGYQQPVDVLLRFFDERLWAVVVRFRQNDPDEAAKTLKERYGEPAGSAAGNLAWVGEKVAINFYHDDRYVETSYRSLNDEIRKQLPAEATPGAAGAS